MIGQLQRLRLKVLSAVYRLLRFVINKPVLWMPLAVAIALLATTHAPLHRHANPWAADADSATPGDRDAASDGASPG